MKLYNILRFLFLFITNSLAGYSEFFQFNHVSGDKYRILNEVSENIYENDRLIDQKIFTNRISVHVVETSADGSGLIESVYHTIERSTGRSQYYGPLTQTYSSSFWRNPNGEIFVGSTLVRPMVRSVPLFPSHDLEPGSKWTSKGEEVHDLGERFGFNEPLKIPINVDYTLRSISEANGKKVGIIEIEYSFFQELNPVLGSGILPVYAIKGEFKSNDYMWDFSRGRPLRYSEQFLIEIFLLDGTKIAFIGNSKGKVVNAVLFNREVVSESLLSDLSEYGLEDIQVRKDVKGVTIVLDNILFTADSAYLWPTEKEKIERIGSILSNFPDNDVLITGHTARVGTEESSQILSEARALAVFKFLKGIGDRDYNSLLYRGQGSLVPLADNATEQGREKNRRVEITILEN